MNQSELLHNLDSAIVLSLFASTIEPSTTVLELLRIGRSLSRTTRAPWSVVAEQQPIDDFLRPQTLGLMCCWE